MCYDIVITQQPIPFLDEDNTSLELQATPLILQRMTSSFLRMLENIAIPGAVPEGDHI